jgi:hypothetical protein
MRIPALPLVASMVLLAAPAFAQTSTTAGTNSDQNGSGYGSQAAAIGSMNQNGANGSSNQQHPANWNGGWQQGMGVSSDTKQRIRQSMMQSGFKDVVVIPEAFAIHAQAPDGSRIVMLLRPDKLTGVIEPTQQTGSSTSPDETNGNSTTYGGSTTTPYGTSR